MYIGSPIHGDDYVDDHNDGEDGTDDDDGDNSDTNHHDESDDDSMASDASSGPSHLGRTHGNGENGHGFAVIKHDGEHDDDDGKYSCFDKKASKSVETLQKKDEKKEQMVLMQGRKAKTPVQSGKKVIKNIWTGKRK